MVENFGFYLKHERELRGVPLEEIAGATKIHIRFLKALEKNHFDELPGEVFVKGYIRSYAKTIGSNVEEVINAYEESVGKKRLEEFQAVQAEEERTLYKKKEVLGFILAGILLLGLVFLGNFIFQQVQGGKTEADQINSPSSSLVGSVISEQEEGFIEEPKPSPELLDPLSASLSSSEPSPQPQSAGSKAESTAPVENEKKAEQEAPKVKEKPPTGETDNLILKRDVNAQPLKEQPKIKLVSIQKISLNAEGAGTLASSLGNTSTNINPLSLKIKVKENSWFNLTVDGSREEDFILPAGSEKSFQGKDEFRITIGNRNSVDISLNDQGLVLPESSDGVVRNFIINAKLIE